MTSPSRPAPREERLSNAVFLALSPKLKAQALEPVPETLAPFERFRIPRVGRPGTLSATFFPTGGEARGVVLFAAPWLPWGQAYFFRRGRIEAVRAAGYHAVTFDFARFGESDGPEGFADRDVEDAARAAQARAPGKQLHLWGVSAGGFWSQAVLAHETGIRGAMFEDVFPHIFDWSSRMRPAVRPAQLMFRLAFPGTHRFFDMRLHLPAARVGATAYVSGAEDRGIRQEETALLAGFTGGESLVIPGAGHLEAIKQAPDAVIALALRTFARAEAGGKS